MLELLSISKTYNKDSENENRIFEDFTLHIEKGKCTALIGSNGCGKSTLMNIIAGDTEIDSGRVILDGEDITNWKEEKRALQIGRVYQNPSFGVSPSLSILENMAIADKKGEKFGLRKLVKLDTVSGYKEKLAELGLGLENKLNTKVKFLSGGQRQSLSLLMAVLKRPKILLLDEHTAALDPKTSKVIMDKTRDLLKKSNITTLMISHNLRDAINYSDRVIMLNQGEVILDEVSEKLTEDMLKDLYRQSSFI